MGNFPGEIQGKIPIFHSMALLLGDLLLFPSEVSITFNSPVGYGADFSPVLKNVKIAETFGPPESITAQVPLQPHFGVHVVVVAAGLPTPGWSVPGAGTCHLQGHPGTLRFCWLVPLLPWPPRVLSARSVSAVHT